MEGRFRPNYFLIDRKARRKKRPGSGSRTRTYDPRINSPLLYQLSYAGVLAARRAGDDSKGRPRRQRGGKPRGAAVYFAIAAVRRGSKSDGSEYSISSIPRSPATIAVHRFVCAGR